MLTLYFDHLHMQTETFRVIIKKNGNGMYNFQTSREENIMRKKINLKEHKNGEKMKHRKSSTNRKQIIIQIYLLWQ